MILTFGEIKSEIYRALDIDASDSTTIDAAERTSIELRINQAQDVVWYDRSWEFRKRTFQLTLRKPYSTGSVSVVEYSRTVTGNGTSWDDSMKLGYLQIGSRQYKINRVVSTTELVLEAPYDKDTESGKDYYIVFTDYILPHTVSAILEVRVRESGINLVAKNQVPYSRATRMEPNACAIQGQTDEDYANEGTVTLVKNSATVTGMGTDFTSYMEGQTFRVNDFSKPYIIKSVDSSAQLTLKQAYEGDGGSGKSYAVMPKGSTVVAFFGAPNDYYYAEIDYLAASEKMVSDSAYSVIPSHDPLLHASVWIAAIDFSNKNPVRIQQARADYEKSLKQLRSQCKAVTNLHWSSPEELQGRRKSINTYNPLDSNKRWA